jgi:hypothetical protein
MVDAQASGACGGNPVEVRVLSWAPFVQLYMMFNMKNEQKINTTFDVYSDTPIGKDPDIYSPTLRKYHSILWSKSLPNGRKFILSIDRPNAYLYHKSDQGEFFLSSDSIGHTYRYLKVMSKIIEMTPKTDQEQFFSICSTIGAYIIFPSKKIDKKLTINGARGLNKKIMDRFDLTLECIRLYYQNKESPLSETLERYIDFFALFESFEGYIDFFLLQDLIIDNSVSINFFLPFDNFQTVPLPSNIKEYNIYKSNVMNFISARNRRIASQFS